MSLKPVPSQYLPLDWRRIETSTEATPLESLAVPQMPALGRAARVPGRGLVEAPSAGKVTPIDGAVASACTVTWLLGALAAVQER